MPSNISGNPEPGNTFRDFEESSCVGVITDTQAKSNIPTLKLDTSIDFSKLDKASASRAEITSVADAFIPENPEGIKVDLDLGKVEEGVRKIKAKQKTEQIRRWVEEAQTLIKQHKFLDALKLIEMAIHGDPESVQIRLLKAYCLFGLDDYDGTLAVLREARPLAADGESILMMLILEGACGRALTQAIEAKLAKLLQENHIDQALALIEREIKKQPRNLALIFHRANLLVLLDRVDDAERVVTEVLPHLEGENLQQFATLLANIKMRASHRYIDAARAALRGNDPNRALAELARCSDVMSGQQHYEAIRSYANSLVPHGMFGGMFQKDKPKQLTEATLQGVLGWLLDNELSTGVEAMKNEKYDQAISIFDRAERIDPRCRAICFLGAVAIFKQFEQAVGNKQVPDLDVTLNSFHKAAALLVSCAHDPAVGEQSRKFAEVVRSYQGQLEAAIKQRALQSTEVIPINNLIEEFKSLMEGLKNHPVSSPNELDSVESQLKNIRGSAERLRKRVSTEAREALGQLLQAVNSNLDQVAEARKEYKKSSSRRSSSSSSGLDAAACIQITVDLKQKMDATHLFSSQERQEYGNIINALRAAIIQARAATRNSQELAALRQCEQILNDLKSRL
jgi:tetratricopeptide (TPR) repeat protein